MSLRLACGHDPVGETIEAIVLLDRRPCIRHLLPPNATCGGRCLSFHAYLRFRDSASRYARPAYLYSPVGIAFERSCYGQILGPRGHLPKFAYSLWRRLDAWVHLDPHLIWQATESYMEHGDAFGLVPHEFSLLHPVLLAKCREQPTTSSPWPRAHARSAH